MDSDYRVALSATVYTGSIASNTSLGTPVINFTMYIDNSYFQNPKTVTIHLVHISPTNTSAFTLENGENTITFTSNSNPSVPNAVSRSIFYSAVTTAGEYELSLVVSVTTGVDSGLDQALEVRGSLVQISIHGELHPIACMRVLKLVCHIHLVHYIIISLCVCIPMNT